MAFSPDGTLLATSCTSRGGGTRVGLAPRWSNPEVSGDETVRLWDVTTGQLRHTFAGGGRCVAFAPDGKRLADGGGDKLVYLWDVPAARKDDR